MKHKKTLDESLEEKVEIALVGLVVAALNTHLVST